MIIVIQHYTCWIYLDLDLPLVFCSMQDYQVKTELDEADWLDPLMTIVTTFRNKITNRPGVAGAVLNSPPSLIILFINWENL